MNLHTLRKSLVTKLPANMQRFIKHRYYYGRLQDGILEREFDVIQHLVKPGQQVLDVGANIGVYSVYLAGLVGESGHVHAIEPIPDTFDVLQYIAGKQDWPHITPYNYAISDTAGTVAMEVPNSDDGTPNYYRANLTSAPQTDSGRMVTNIQAFPLDDLFAELPITFIKCDVEGHELACIRGARALISHAKPAWFIEVSGDPDQTELECPARAGSHARGRLWLLLVRRRRAPRAPGRRPGRQLFLPDGLAPGDARGDLRRVDPEVKRAP